MKNVLGSGLRNISGPPSPFINIVSLPTGHCINMESFSIVGREAQGVTSTIKEAMFIRVNDPYLNRNLGKYQLPHIWDHIWDEVYRSPLPPSQVTFHHISTMCHPFPHGIHGDTQTFFMLVSTVFQPPGVPNSHPLWHQCLSDTH